MTDFLSLEVDHTKTYIVDGKLSSEAYVEFKKALGYKPENFQWIKQGVLERKVAEATRGVRDSGMADQIRERIKRGMDNWDGTVTDVCYDKARCRCQQQEALYPFLDRSAAEGSQVF